LICFFTEIGIYTHNQFLQAGTRAADMADVDPETLLEWLQIVKEMRETCNSLHWSSSACCC